MRVVKLKNKLYFFNFGDSREAGSFGPIQAASIELSKLYRVFNILLVILVAVISVPFFLFAYITINFFGGGNVFYKQLRLGLGAKKFYIYKFRTMVVDAEQTGQPVWAEAKDPRITKYGKFLRRTRIDELPQLWNVLKGDMNLVGPRPERPEFHGKILEKIPNFDARLSVRPGITGLAQIEHGYVASIDANTDKFELDSQYIEQKSYMKDLYILARTVKVVLTGFGAR